MKKGLFYDLAQEARGIYNMADPKARRPYKWGSKDFLTNIKVGEQIVFDDDARLSYRGLQQVAAQLRRTCGCQFQFRTHKVTKQRRIRRIA